MGFSRQEYWSGLPFPSPGDFPHPGTEPGSPALQEDSLPTEPLRLPSECRNLGLIPELGRSPGEGNDNPLQYSCLENSTDRGAWLAIVHWIAKSQTWQEFSVVSSGANRDGTSDLACSCSASMCQVCPFNICMCLFPLWFWCNQLYESCYPLCSTFTNGIGSHYNISDSRTTQASF